MAASRRAIHNCCSNPQLDDADGTTVCTNCGTVHSESHIVSEITFGESASGAAVVQGSFVGAGETHARSQGPFRRGGGLESREATVAEGKRTINTLANAMNIPDRYSEAGMRWFTLAVTHNFIQGRKTKYVVAACLYIVCRQEKSSHMLIDFSDILAINVFVLGQTFLKLIRVLNVHVPYLDPSVYIHRFAKHLEFGKDTNKVASDAVRLVQRMNRDWIVQGRRPSGICGACLVIAARMNNYRRSVKEVVYVVKVADVTIQKRLDEFKATQSSALTVDEFRSLWLEQAHDPPSFGPKKKKRKRVRGENGEWRDADSREGTPAEEEEEREGTPAEGAAGGGGPAEMQVEVRRDADGFAIPALPTDPKPNTQPSASPGNPLPTPPATQPTDTGEGPSSSSTGEGSSTDALSAAMSAVADAAIESEITRITDSILTTQASTVEEIRSARLIETERATAAFASISSDPENLLDVDDDEEVANCILSERESEIKESIWIEFNKDWMMAQEEKRLKRERDERNGVTKARKKRKGKGGKGEVVVPSSPAESAKMLLQKRGFSRKINYAAIDHLFETESP